MTGRVFHSFAAQIIKLEKLRTQYFEFKHRRELVSQYDLFLCDDRILPMLTKTLGKTFLSVKKQPVPIRLKKTQSLRDQVRRARESTFLCGSHGDCWAIKLAHTAMTDEEVTANLMAGITAVVERIPRKWKNIKSVSIKSPDSVALPVYSSLGDLPPITSPASRRAVPARKSVASAPEMDPKTGRISKSRRRLREHIKRLDRGVKEEDVVGYGTGTRRSFSTPRIKAKMFKGGNTPGATRMRVRRKSPLTAAATGNASDATVPSPAKKVKAAEVPGKVKDVKGEEKDKKDVQGKAKDVKGEAKEKKDVQGKAKGVKGNMTDVKSNVKDVKDNLELLKVDATNLKKDAKNTKDKVGEHQREGAKGTKKPGVKTATRGTKRVRDDEKVLPSPTAEIDAKSSCHAAVSSESLKISSGSTEHRPAKVPANAKAKTQVRSKKIAESAASPVEDKSAQATTLVPNTKTKKRKPAVSEMPAKVKGGTKKTKKEMPKRQRSAVV